MTYLQFVHPWFLYFLWLVPAVGAAWLLIRGKKGRKLESFFSADMLKKLCAKPSSNKFYRQWSLLLTGLALAIIAGARPQWGTREEQVFQRGRDLVIALDVSRSMLAQDVRPNRLERAKADIMDLLRELRGDRAALVAFRNGAVQICPLTTDYSFLESALDSITIDSAPPGQTDIGSGILKALESFDAEDGAHKAIILISDGEDLSDRVMAAAQAARARAIPVFTIGLGSVEGSVMPDASGKLITYQDKEVKTRLEHEAMKEIARITDGVYIPVGTANVRLGPLYRDHLNKIAAQDIEEVIHHKHVDRYQWFLFPALLLFFVTASLSAGQPAIGKKTIRKTATKSLLAVTFCFIAGICAATNDQHAIASEYETKITDAVTPAGRDGAHIAKRLYREGEYRRAAEIYMQAAKNASSRLQNDILFNAACALYRAGEYEAAAKQFENLSRHEKTGASSLYNLGAALYQMAEPAGEDEAMDRNAKQLKLLEQSGKAFQKALRADPENHAAGNNLTIVADILPSVREQVKIKELMTEYGEMQPFQIAQKMLNNQREINEKFKPVLTNTSPERIKLFEELGNLQNENADLLIPLKPALMAAIQPEQAPMLDQQVEVMRDIMHKGARQLRDLDGRAHDATMPIESAIYEIWKGTAPYSPILDENIQRQTNSINMTSELPEHRDDKKISQIREELKEAAELTGLFTNRFMETTPESATDATMPDPDSKPDEETRAKILDLASDALTLQNRAISLLEKNAQEASLTAQKEAYDILREIQELLPEEEDEQQSEGQDGEEKQEDQQNQDGQEDQQQEEGQQDQEDRDDQEPAQPEESPPEQEEDSEEQQPEEEDSDEITPEQAKTILERVQQREREHQREKMLRSQRPPETLDMDW